MGVQSVADSLKSVYAAVTDPAGGSPPISVSVTLGAGQAPTFLHDENGGMNVFVIGAGIDGRSVEVALRVESTQENHRAFDLIERHATGETATFLGRWGQRPWRDQSGRLRATPEFQANDFR